MQFNPFKPHIDLAHHYWSTHIQKGDIVIDATCGNGHDTLALAKLALTPTSGQVHALDIQSSAIQSTMTRLKEHLSPQIRSNIYLHHRCHSLFPHEMALNSVKLISYNLGYLPKKDKSITTEANTTLKSLENAAQLLCVHGMICITCYPGHPTGKIETDATLAYLSNWDSAQFTCCHHHWINRKEHAPSVIIIQKQETS